MRFLELQSGGFLGLGGETRLVPVDAVTDIDDEHVYVGGSRERIHGSRPYEPSLAEERSYWEEAYGYYGAAPYWGLGYAYPLYPFARRPTEREPDRPA